MPVFAAWCLELTNSDTHGDGCQGYACRDPEQECTLMEAIPAMDGLHSLDNVVQAMLTVWTVSGRCGEPHVT